MPSNINPTLWDAAQPQFLGQKDYLHRSIDLVGGNYRLEDNSWFVPLEVNLPIIDLPGPARPVETMQGTIGQNALKDIEGPNYRRYSPPPQPQMTLNPNFCAMRDIPRAIGGTRTREQRRQEKRNGTYHQNRLPVEQRQPREVRYVDADQRRQFLVQKGLVPNYPDSEDDTDDDGEWHENCSAAQLKARIYAAVQENRSKGKTHEYKADKEGVLPRDPREGVLLRDPNEAMGQTFDQAQQANSGKSSRGVASFMRESTAEREEGRPRCAVKSLKETVAPRSQADENGSPRRRPD